MGQQEVVVTERSGEIWAGERCACDKKRMVTGGQLNFDITIVLLLVVVVVVVVAIVTRILPSVGKLANNGKCLC
jgi:hypothetical protein